MLEEAVLLSSGLPKHLGRQVVVRGEPGRRAAALRLRLALRDRGRRALRLRRFPCLDHRDQPTKQLQLRKPRNFAKLVQDAQQERQQGGRTVVESCCPEFATIRSAGCVGQSSPVDPWLAPLVRTF